MPGFRRLGLVVTALALFAMSACGPVHQAFQATPGAAIAGNVHGGQQPVAGAGIKVFAVSGNGDGTAAQQIWSPGQTDAAGNFVISVGICPASDPLVYLVATGGNPGLAAGTNNLQLSLITALGHCSAALSATVVINEVTTVAAIYSLSPFITRNDAIGSGTSDAAALSAAFAQAAEYANIAYGTSPGTGVPTGYSAPSDTITTIADILAPCINSSGGLPGDGSSCATLFALTTPQGGIAPTDTFTAVLNLANNPTLNTAGLYNLVTPAAPFQPALTIVPADLSLALIPGTPSFTVAPSTGLTFPTTNAGSTSPAQTVTITNTGNITLLFGLTQSNPTTYAFTLSQSSPIAIGPGQSRPVSVTFTPSFQGTFRSNLVISPSNAPLSAQVVLLSGTATGPNLTDIGATGGISFSYNIVNTTATQTTTVTNSGTGPAAISSIYLTGDTVHFTQINDCPPVLAVAASCTFTLTFTPNAAGNFGASLHIDGPPYPGGTISLFGAGLYGYGLTPPVLSSSIIGMSFNAVRVGNSASLPFTLTDTGGANIDSITFTLTGPNAGDFLPTGNCVGNILYSGYSCTVNVYFTPTGAGHRNATLTMTTSPASTPVVVTLDGIATVPYYSVAVSPASATFPGSYFGAPPLYGQYFTVTNTGQGTNQLGAPTITGPNPADFSVNSYCSLTVPLAPAATCQVLVLFRAWGLGLRTATLSIPSQANSGPSLIPLSGTGIANAPPYLNSSVTSVVFPTIVVSSTSTPIPLTLSDYKAPSVTISSITITGPNASDFSQTNNCATLIYPNYNNCTVQITATPSGTGARTATLTIVSDDPASPQSIPLLVTGQ